jgi:hypothetical protein
MEASTKLGFWVGGTCLAASVAMTAQARGAVIAQDGIGEYAAGGPIGDQGWGGSEAGGAGTGIATWTGDVGQNIYGDLVTSGSVPYPGLTPVADSTGQILQGSGYGGIGTDANFDTSPGGVFGQAGLVGNGNSYIGVPGQTLYMAYTFQIFNENNSALPPTQADMGSDQAYIAISEGYTHLLTIGESGGSIAAQGNNGQSDALGSLDSNDHLNDLAQVV